MTSVDDKIQNVQDNILSFLNVSVEPLFTEYVAIPLFFEWTFNSKQLPTLRAISTFLLLVRQLIKQNIKINKPYNTLLLVAALLAYVSSNTNDLATAFIYALAYSPNINESLALALTTTAAAALYSFNTATAFHIIYILIRNNLSFDTTQIVKLQIMPHKTLSERRANIDAMAVTLIHNCCDLAE